MRFKMLTFYLLITLFSVLSCNSIDSPAKIEGKVSFDQNINKTNNPIFVIASKSLDFNEISNNPDEYIMTTTATDEDGYFIIDDETLNIKRGDKIYLFAFQDNDYSNKIPVPTPGDTVGFYSNGFDLQYTVGSETANITISRIQYDCSANVIGIIDTDLKGKVTLIAYAGDFNSSDLSSININDIIGYKNIELTGQPISYKLNILPYGYNIPIGGVYIIALLDNNNNSIPDEGDLIGFATQSNNSPETITINEGTTTAPPINFIIQVYDENSDNKPQISINGEFDAPGGYTSDPDSKPIFIVVAKGDNPTTIFENIKNLNTDTFDYVRVNQGDTTFTLDLSNRKFSPGDKVMIIALWDKDFNGGLPQSTQGDKLGLLLNKNDFEYTVTLAEGTNTIEKSGDSYLYNASGGYSFTIDRNVYDHNASLRFKLEQGDLNNSQFANGTNVLCVAIYETETVSTGYNIDMDKIIATATVRIQHEDGQTITDYYTMNIMPAIHETIPATDNGNFMLNDIWVLAILDSNGNGKPDNGENIGFYWNWLLIYYPAKLPVPIGDGIYYLDKTVRFSNNTY